MHNRMLNTRLQAKSVSVSAIGAYSVEPFLVVEHTVYALLGSIDDTLSDEAILDELIGLDIGGITFLETFADNSPKS